MLPECLPGSSKALSKERTNSYGDILKSSSIAGAAQAVSLVVGMFRTKLVAVLLGPGGVGLIGLYESTFGLVGTLTGLGIGQSAVRQVAEAHGSGDVRQVGRTVCVLRRVCLFTGLMGAVLTACLANPLSFWTFGNTERALPICILGVTLLLTAISDGQSALLRGVRRIGDLARMQVISSLVTLVSNVALYAWLGERGIVPVFVVSAAVNLGFSWWFARRATLTLVAVSPRETFAEARGLVNLGLAFMFSSLLAAVVTLATRSLILRDFGIDANGLYQAAWSVSGVFAGFILNAMSMDFYPRLTAATGDGQLVNRLVNEQGEIGILLALPGLLATAVFSPWILQILYSSAFKPAAELLPWFVLGIFGRVVSWPMGFIQLAKGSARWFSVTQAVFHILHFAFIWTGLRLFGLVGVAFAFALAYVCHTVVAFLVARGLTGFSLSRDFGLLLAEAGVALLLTFLLTHLAPLWAVASFGGALVALCSLFSLRRICLRLGDEHRISRYVASVPAVGPWLLK